MKTHSFSTYQTFVRCRRRYYLTEHIGFSPPPNPAMKRGLAIHEALAAFYRDGRVALDTTPPELQGLLVNYVAWQRGELPWEAVAVEPEAKVPSSYGDLTFHPDLVVLRDSDLAIVEHKSGEPDVRLYLLEGQAHLYAAVWFIAYGKIPEWVCYNVLADSGFSRHWQKANIAYGMHILGEIGEAQQWKPDGLPPPQPYYDCPRCPVFEPCVIGLQYGADRAIEAALALGAAAAAPKAKEEARLW